VPASPFDSAPFDSAQGKQHPFEAAPFDSAQEPTRPPRRSTVAIPHARGALYQTLARACKPRPPQTVSEWANKHRILTSKGSGEPGPWRTDRTPYLREIMDCLSARSSVQRVVMMFGAQLGKTEAGLNWIGYVMHHAPGPMLAVVPTLEVRKRWVKQRLDPLLTETPAIRDLLDVRRRRDSANAEDMKDFPGGLLVLGGANSAASLASMPIRYVLCDEVDRFPWEVGQEGDPLGLIDERTKTFPRRKVLLISTPTVKGLSRIETEYEASDQRQYHVPCPECGELQVLHWRRPDGNYGLVHSPTTGRVWYACAHCGAMIDEQAKPQMLAAGRWIPQFPDRPVRGYRLSGLYSPIGLGFSWAEIWNKWEDAHKDTSNLKRFINTTLGELWEEAGDTLDDVALFARREAFDPSGMDFHAITAGCDIQADRIEFSVYGWGVGEEAWCLEHVIVPGDTAAPAVWEEFAEELSASGVEFACIDSGYNTSFVYEFCERRSWAYPTKGQAGAGRPLIEDQLKRLQRLRKSRRRGQRLEPIGVDQGKTILFSRWRQPLAGPGFVHFRDCPSQDEEFFAQLAAEKLVAEIKGGKRQDVWKAMRPRNEALDCAVLALAAVRLSGRKLEGPPRVRLAGQRIATPDAGKLANRGEARTNLAKDGWEL
jgi:phage terminase large subunit GpA-like protein